MDSDKEMIQVARFDYLFERLMGYIVPEDADGIENLFEGECGELYDKIYDWRIEISRRLEDNLDGESPTVLAIVSAYERMAYFIARRSYMYGYEDGQRAGSAHKLPTDKKKYQRSREEY